MAEDIDITSCCLICKKPITCTIDKMTILTASKLPVPFKIEHCGTTFIILIDANFNCIETHMLFNHKKEDGIRSHLIDSEFLSKLSPDDLVLFEYNLKEGFILDRIPDLAEKHLIRVISKSQGVSLSKLIRECAILGKALNRNISREDLLNILDKYIEKEIIIKQEIKMEEEESSSQFKTNILQGGNI